MKLFLWISALALVLMPTLAAAQSGPPPWITMQDGTRRASTPAPCYASPDNGVTWVPCTPAGSGTTAAPGSNAANGQAVQGIDGGKPVATTLSHLSYTLATGATSAGTIAVQPDTYALNLPTAFGGATATVTTTSGNGATVTTTYTAAPSTPPLLSFYGATTIAVTYSGGTPTGATLLSGGPTFGASGSPQATYQTWGPATSSPVATTVSTTTVTTSAAFVPQLARPILLTITGTWAGQVQLLRSVDGGATLLPLTFIDGSAKGVFTVNAQTPVATESEAAASYFLRYTLTSGSATGRLAQ